MIGGSLWPGEKKRIDSTYQPCTSTWKIEPKYNELGVLMNNWYEDREKYRVSIRPQLLLKYMELIRLEYDIRHEGSFIILLNQYFIRYIVVVITRVQSSIQYVSSRRGCPLQSVMRM